MTMRHPPHPVLDVAVALLFRLRPAKQNGWICAAGVAVCILLGEVPVWLILIAALALILLLNGSGFAGESMT